MMLDYLMLSALRAQLDELDEAIRFLEGKIRAEPNPGAWGEMHAHRQKLLGQWEHVARAIEAIEGKPIPLTPQQARDAWIVERGREGGSYEWPVKKIALALPDACKGKTGWDFIKERQIRKVLDKAH